MVQAGLDPKQNLWDKVYDFSDHDQTGKNWNIKNFDSDAKFWCPLGEAKNCCALDVESTPVSSLIVSAKSMVDNTIGLVSKFLSWNENKSGENLTRESTQRLSDASENISWLRNLCNDHFWIDGIVSTSSSVAKNIMDVLSIIKNSPMNPLEESEEDHE